MRKLLIIDDSETMREFITDAGEKHGWEVAGYDSLDEVQTWLEANTPDVVILDWGLTATTPAQFAELLSAKELLCRTLLLSAEYEDERKGFIEQYRLAGFRQKPLKKGSFEDWVTLPASASVAVDIKTVVDNLPLALDLLDNGLVSHWSNERAKKYPPTPEHRRVMGWLKTELDLNSAAESVRRLDWDGGRERFLDTRMYKLPDNRYWLARDWRGDGERPHDQELLKFEETSDRNEWHKAVAKLLAERYEITRTRVYKVANLPVTDRLGEKPLRLVIPLFQSGGGFFGNSDAGWLNTGFLVESNGELSSVIGNSERPMPRHVSNMSIPGCGHIDFGPNGTTHVRIPVRNDKHETIALIALDERSDQLPYLTGFDKEIVEIARGMASDQINALSSEQWSLMSGLMGDIASRLGRRLQDGEQKRTVDWHNAISHVLGETFSNSQRSTEMTYDGLTAVCGGLVKEWVKGDSGKIISGHIMGTSEWDSSRKIEPLSAWFIALMTDENHWQAVAGWGGAYDACRQQGEQELLEPLATAHQGDPWKAVLIQDYETWEKMGHAHKCCPCGAVACPKEIHGWLAVPMQLDGRIQAMMVVHTRHPHYFTEFRVKLLETAAKRLLPLLAAAQREQRARSVFTASIMHEVKNAAHDALMLIDEVQTQLSQLSIESVLPKHLSEVRHHLEGLEMLGLDALDVFQLGSEVREGVRTSNDTELIGQLGTVLDGMLNGWRAFYEDTEVRLNLDAGLEPANVAISSGAAFKRVLRALLHNAFRHGQDWVHITVKFVARDKAQRLSITISNRAYRDVAQDLSRRVIGKRDDFGGSTRLHGHLGLAVARQLVAEAHGNLTDLTWQVMEGDSVQAAITLTWPIRIL